MTTVRRPVLGAPDGAAGAALLLPGLRLRPQTFWLVAGPPGAGKTSFLVRLGAEAVEQGVPAVLVAYEPTEGEVRARLRGLARARLGGPHGEVAEEAVRAMLGRWLGFGVLAADPAVDTVSLVREALTTDGGLRPGRPALVLVDYLGLVPVFGGEGGLLAPTVRAGEAAAALRQLCRQTGWTVVAAAALRREEWTEGRRELFGVFGDERVVYEADGVLLLEPGSARPCGCRPVRVHRLKDRWGPTGVETWTFWGERTVLGPDLALCGEAAP